MGHQNDLCRKVTATIADALRRGVVPWRRPWHGVANSGPPANVATGAAYTGVNTMLLSVAAANHGFKSRWWGTRRQWQALGLRVLARPAGVAPGDWSCGVVYCLSLGMTPTAACSTVDPRPRRRETGEAGSPNVVREYVLFNAQQVKGDGVEGYLAAPLPSGASPDFGPADRLLACSGAVGLHDDHADGYFPAVGRIRLLPRSAFAAPADYYTAVFNGLVRWAGHPARFNRPGATAPPGSPGHAREALVAEAGAGLLASVLDIPPCSDPLPRERLDAWLAVIDADPAAIFTAASRASEAANYLMRRVDG